MARIVFEKQFRVQQDCEQQDCEQDCEYQVSGVRVAGGAGVPHFGMSAP
jgi:hypothetical protein